MYSMDKYLYAGICLQNGRPSNMDSLLLKPRRVDKVDALLAVVCDGVGSLADGGFASGMAVRMLSDWFDNLHDFTNVGANLMSFLLEANLYLVEQAAQGKFDTASTLTVLLLVKNSYYLVHLGDSRIYGHKNGHLSVITKDDTSPEGKLTGYIGRKRDIYPQYHEGDASGMTFLVCSDGFYKRMDADFLLSSMETLGESKKDLSNAANILAQHVIDQGEKDNITLALLRVLY